MRHRKKVKKLGRTVSHRKATLRNIASALITHHQIRTTLAKAKAARSHIERLITYGKKDTVHSRRLAFKFLQNRTLVKKLFDEIAPTYADRNGGYTRIIKLGQRVGDGANLAILQLVGFEETLIGGKEKKTSKRSSAKKRPARKEKAKPETEAVKSTSKSEKVIKEAPPKEKKIKVKPEKEKKKVTTKTEKKSKETKKEAKKATRAAESKTDTKKEKKKKTKKT